MPLPPGPSQQEGRTPHDHFAAVAEEVVEHVAQVDRTRLAFDQGDAVDAEHRLQLRQRVEIVEHDIAGFAAAEFDDDAHAILVGLVAQFADADDALFLYQLRDLLDESGLVDLVGDLGDHDGLLAATGILDVGSGAHVDASLGPRGTRARCRPGH